MYGLIGFPLSHSFSPAFFAAKFQQLRIEASYELFPLQQVADFKQLRSRRPKLKGLNVTIPYKEQIIPYLDELSPEASAIQAVNCIQFRDGKLIGHNTDAWGFEFSLIPYLPAGDHRALVFGTGGSSKAICYVLTKHQIPYHLVSRTAREGILEYRQIDAHRLATATILINSTPVGMHPEVDEELPLPYDALDKGHFLFDLVYNPLETKFLKRGRIRGAYCKNGLEMLYLQAEKSWHLWNPDFF